MDVILDKIGASKLRKNRVGDPWPNGFMYLDTHTRLLREEVLRVSMTIHSFSLQHR